MITRKDDVIWQRRRAIWYFSGCVMVAIILIVGGLTRLNQAGLSITEWEVVSGVIPPLSEAQWNDAFDTYRQFPEYQHIHRGMSLPEFKVIYLWEYTHRLLSRLLGFLFLIPLIVFVWKRAIPVDELVKLGGIVLLGAAQAFLGWYMVQSGLDTQPVVSHLRLGIHLVVAFLIFGFLWKLAISTIPNIPRRLQNNVSRQMVRQSLFRYLFNINRMKLIGTVTIVLLLLQVLIGGWTAGLKAGYVYPTFPKMGAYWIPPELGLFSPWWFDLSHNAISVQFLHRFVASIMTLLVVPMGIFALRSSERVLQITGFILLLVISIQIVTGAFNVLLGIPVWLSSVHQFGALILLAALLTLQRFMHIFH